MLSCVHSKSFSSFDRYGRLFVTIDETMVCTNFNVEFCTFLLFIQLEINEKIFVSARYQTTTWISNTFLTEKEWTISLLWFSTIFYYSIIKSKFEFGNFFSSNVHISNESKWAILYKIKLFCLAMLDRFICDYHRYSQSNPFRSIETNRSILRRRIFVRILVHREIRKYLSNVSEIR